MACSLFCRIHVDPECLNNYWSAESFDSVGFCSQLVHIDTHLYFYIEGYRYKEGEK